MAQRWLLRYFEALRQDMNKPIRLMYSFSMSPGASPDMVVMDAASLALKWNVFDSDVYRL